MQHSQSNKIVREKDTSIRVVFDQIQRYYKEKYEERYLQVKDSHLEHWILPEIIQEYIPQLVSLHLRPKLHIYMSDILDKLQLEGQKIRSGQSTKAVTASFTEIILKFIELAEQREKFVNFERSVVFLDPKALRKLPSCFYLKCDLEETSSEDS